jgi:undecaprenyl diphosphate synthase
VRVRIIGDRSDLESDILEIIERAETRTIANSRLNLTIAFNYGGQCEIARTARRIAEQVAAGHLDPATIDEQVFTANLDTAGLPDPDLVIRTSGEKRLSNFLLWQAAYAEFVFLDTLWPDFGRPELEAALVEFRRRERRFGAVSA